MKIVLITKKNTIEPYMRTDPPKGDYPGMVVEYEYIQSTCYKLITIFLKNLESFTNLHFYDFKRLAKISFLGSTNTICLPNITNNYVAWTLTESEKGNPSNILMKKVCYVKTE